MSDAPPRFSRGERVCLSLMETTADYPGPPGRLSPAEVRTEIVRAITAAIVVASCVVAVLLR